MRKLELESIIENLELELEFTDMTTEQEAQAHKDIEQARKELAVLNK